MEEKKMFWFWKDEEQYFQTTSQSDPEKKIPNGPNNEFCTSIDKVSRHLFAHGLWVKLFFWENKMETAQISVEKPWKFKIVWHYIPGTEIGWLWEDPTTNGGCRDWVMGRYHPLR